MNDMRRFLLVLLAGLLFNAYAFAQVIAPIQTGKATRELVDSGLSAAHFNIPLGARVKISNAETGKEIEVVIRGRIPLSPNRIVDLSPAAWDALELTADTDVRLVPPAPLAGSGEGRSNAANRAPAVETQETEWFTIQVHPGTSPVKSWELKIITEDSEHQITIQGTPAGSTITTSEGEKPAEIAAGTEVAAETTFAAGTEVADKTAVAGEIAERAGGEKPEYQPRQPIKIFPCLPDPDDYKIYRLQLGAFREAMDIAEKYERQAQTAGFTTAREMYGPWTRVLVVDIPASKVWSAAQALEAAGFTEVWVRE